MIAGLSVRGSIPEPFYCNYPHISELLGLIYEAALDESRWRAFLDAYAEAVGARRATLILNTRHQNGTSPLRSSGWPDEDVIRYSQGRTGGGVFHRPEGSQHPTVEVQAIDRLYPGEGSDLCTAYPWSCGSGSDRYGVLGWIPGVGDAPSKIVALRAEQDGPFGDAAFGLLRALLPHLRQAALLQSELASLRTRLAAFATYLDRSPFPFLLVDADGRLLHINAIARETVSLKDGIAITAGQFSVMSAKGQVVLINAIREVAGGIGGPLLRLDVQRPSGRPPYRLLVMSLPSSAATPPGVSQRAVAMLIIDREAGKELDPEILAELYSLTPTQARVTGRLAVGRSAEEIAREMGLSLETVRTHIRHVLSKTGTGRQGELIALILRSAPFRPR